MRFAHFRKWLLGDERGIVGVDHTGRLVVNRERLYRHPNYQRQITALKRLDALLRGERP